MAPKKAVEEKMSKEAEVTEAVAQEEEVEKKTGNFVMPNGSTYVGEYLYIRKAKPAPTGEVAGTALEPLSESEELKIHGRGKLLFGPELFDGEWRNGEMVKGKHVFASGAVYDGFFMNNKFHGLGKYSWSDGREYEGMFNGGKMHGEGLYRNFTDGQPSEFAGISANGQFQSGHEQQEASKTAFVEAYGAPILASARATLAKTPGEFPDLLVAPDLATDWAAGRTIDQIVDRCASPDQLAEGENAEDLEKVINAAKDTFPEMSHLLSGPFPTAEAFPLVQGLVDGLVAPPPAEGEEPAEPTTTIRIVVEPVSAVRTAMLQYRGQCVELSGAAGTVMLCNVGVSRCVPSARNDADSVGDYDINQSVWRLISAQAAPPPE